MGGWVGARSGAPVHLCPGVLGCSLGHCGAGAEGQRCEAWVTFALRALAAAPSAFMSTGPLAAPPGVMPGASPAREIAGDAESKPPMPSAGLEGSESSFTSLA